MEADIKISFKEYCKTKLLAPLRYVLINFTHTDLTARLPGKGKNKASTQLGSTEELSTREQEVLQLILKEYSNKKIADTLLISERKVDRYWKSLFEKTHSTGIVDLIDYAYKHKLI